MQRAIRIAVCLSVAATLTPVFADEATGNAGRPQDETPAASMDAADDLGSGSGEPAGTDARLETQQRAEDAMKARAEKTAIDLQSHEQFVRLVWASP